MGFTNPNAGPGVPKGAFTQKGESLKSEQVHLSRGPSGSYHPSAPKVSDRTGKSPHSNSFSDFKAHKLGAGKNHPLFKAVHLQLKHLHVSSKGKLTD